MSEQSSNQVHHDPLSASAPITDRANNEPAIMRGLTASETTIAALVLLPVWMLIGVLVAVVTNIWALAVLIASLAPMVNVWVLAGWLATVKRDRPDNYYMHKFWLWTAKSGLTRSYFINHDGSWSLGREFDVPHKKSK